MEKAIGTVSFSRILNRKKEMIKMLKAIIFDLDGTLLYTLEDLKNAVNYALEESGMPVRSLEEIKRFVGNGVKKLVIRAVEGGEDNPLFEKVFSDFKEYYKLHCNDNTMPYDGVMELLNYLNDKGIKMAIVSNKFDAAVKSLNKEYFNGLMESAVGEMEGVERKPAPDMVYKALKELDVKPDEAIYVGDSEVDIMTAKNAGLKSIQVTWGFRDKEFLIANGGDNFVDTPMEIIEKCNL